jgi:broad specificity phosphatase PhoE
LAGFGSVAQIDGDLVEWDYGEYEGRLTVDILKEARTGNCSAMAVPAANRHSKSQLGLIV